MKKIVLALILILGSFLPSFSQQPTDIESLMYKSADWIVENSDFSWDGEIPEFEFTNSRTMLIYLYGTELVELAEKPDSSTSLPKPQGIYNHNENKIYLLEDFDPVADEYVIVHEMVHFLQDQNGLLHDCAPLNEREAYELHAEWIEQTGNPGTKVNELWLFMAEESCKNREMFERK